MAQHERETARGRGQDRQRINVHEDYEARYWSKTFGVSRDALREAVRRVGVMARNVAAYFQRRPRSKPAA